MAQKKRAPMFTTPSATLKYPWLNKPDTKFDENGKYHVKVLLDPEVPEHAEFMEKLTTFFEDKIKELKADLTPAKAKKVKTPYQVLKDEEDGEGEETGRQYIDLTMNAQFTKEGQTRKLKPFIFDAKNKKIENPPRIFSGSIAKVAFTFDPGLNPKGEVCPRMRLYAVQILELVEGQASGEGFGFGAEEGFEAGDAPADTSQDSEPEFGDGDPDVAAEDDDDDF